MGSYLSQPLLNLQKIHVSVRHLIEYKSALPDVFVILDHGWQWAMPRFARPISVSDMPSTPPPPFDPYGIHDRLHVRLLSMRCVTLSTDLWTYDDLRSSYWKLYVNRDPGGSILWDGQEFKVTPRCAFLVPAWVTLSSRCKGEVDHLYFHFDIVGLGSPMVRHWFDRPIALPHDQMLEDLSEHVRTTLRHGKHDDISTAFASKSLVNLSVALLFDLMEHRGGQQPSKGHLLLRHLAELTPVLPALRRIDDTLSEPTSNNELAERCGMSEDHFIRIFQKCVGQTPARYALERRLQFAAERLVFSDDSLKMIAAQAGFSNRFHFSRAFTRIIGVPPARYRESGHV